MRREILVAKIVTTIIIALTIVGIARADEKIDVLFRKYRAPAGLIAIVESAGEKFGIDPKIIASIIVVESSARPKAVSKGGDYGLMQVRWKVHKKDIQRRFPTVKTAEDLLEPSINVAIGTEIFARYQQGRTLRDALLRYSGGNRTMADRVLRILRGLLLP